MEKIIQRGNVRSLNVSDKKGVKKSPVRSIVIDAKGISGDAHSGEWHRQVSFLADESADRMRERMPSIAPGDFAENVTTRGIDFRLAKIGQKIRAGGAVLEISQIGKECHSECEIKRVVGSCIMPVEGVFAKVISGGKVSEGDEVVIYE